MGKYFMLICGVFMIVIGILSKLHPEMMCSKEEREYPECLEFARRKGAYVLIIAIPIFLTSLSQFL